jgi:hypothetical protein
MGIIYKSVQIQIASSDLNELRRGGYHLCFAKKVGEESYNVVWRGFSQYLQDNTFSWAPLYELFGINTFRPGQIVQSSTATVDIDLGETSVLDSNGVLRGARAGGKPQSISMQNDYGWIHTGLSQLGRGIDGTKFWTPIFVTPQQRGPGLVEMTPVDKIMVWFEQKIETSTMFDGARGRAIEIDLTNGNSAARLYRDQKWVTP